jgi:hypothetical protein
MFLTAILLWVAGLLTVVPYSTYYLLFEASRDQYAFLITLVLFWIFGYWSLAGPLLMAVKVRAVFRAIESATSRDNLEAVLKSSDARDVAIDLIATENRIPRFVARRVVNLLLSRLSNGESAPDRQSLEVTGSRKP